MMHKWLLFLFAFSVNMTLSVADDQVNLPMEVALTQSMTVSNGIQLEKIGHNWAIFSWNLPDLISDGVKHHIFRNNKLIASLNSEQSVFKDFMLEPNTHYTYHIQSKFKPKFSEHLPKVSFTTLNNTKPKFDDIHEPISIPHDLRIGSHIYQFKATDYDTDKLYFNIKGKGEDVFMINQSTGALINGASLSKNQTYLIIVQVSDGMARQDLSVTIKTY